MQKHVYELMAEQQKWHWWYQTKREVLATVLSTAKLPNYARILELGSGVGANFPTLRKLGAVEGIEYSKLARDFSQKNHPEKVVAGDLNTFKLQAKKYDVICILDVLYHQNIRDDKKVIKRAADGLKTNGYLLITDCAHQWLYGPHDKENMARQRYSKKELEEKVENAGLQIVRSSYVFCFTFPLFVFVRLKQKIFDKDDQSESQNDVLNKIFAFVGKLEARLLRFFPLPFGSSILILAQKKSLT